MKLPIAVIRKYLPAGLSPNGFKLGMSVVAAGFIVSVTPIQVAFALNEKQGTGATGSYNDATFVNGYSVGYYHVGDSGVFDLDTQSGITNPQAKPALYTDLSVKTDDTVYNYGNTYDANGNLTGSNDQYLAKPVYGSVQFVTLPNGDRGIKYTADKYEPVNENDKLNNLPVRDTIIFKTTDALGNSRGIQYLTATVFSPLKNLPDDVLPGVQAISRGSVPVKPEAPVVVAPTPQKVAITAADSTATTGKPTQVKVNLNSPLAISNAHVSVEVYNDGPSQVSFTEFSQQNLKQGDNTFIGNWTPSAAGTYTVAVDLYAGNNGEYAKNAYGIAKVVVSDPAASTTPAQTKAKKVVTPTPTTTPAPVTTPVVTPTAPVATTPAQPANLNITGNSLSAATNQSSTATITVNASAAVSNALIDVETYDANNQRVNQTVYEAKDLVAGRNSFLTTWTPNKAGSYSIRAGVFTAGWQKNLTWNNDVSTVKVADPVIATTTTQPITTAPITTQAPTFNTNILPSAINIWWPSNGAAVSGTQPFKAVIDGRLLNSYSLYWQVDGGTLNQLSDTDGNHKESSVNVSGWKSQSNGKYKITFVAKDLNGTIISSKDTAITVQ